MRLSRLASTTVPNHTSPRPSTLAKRFETASQRQGKVCRRELIAAEDCLRKHEDGSRTRVLRGMRRRRVDERCMFPDGLAAEYFLEGWRIVDVDDRNVGATEIRAAPSPIPPRAVSPSFLHGCAKLLNAELEPFPVVRICKLVARLLLVDERPIDGQFQRSH